MNFEVRMKWKKSTPGTQVYEEIVDIEGVPPRLRALYLPKWLVGNPWPERLRVTVETDEKRVGD